jgi:hypothetical protein
MLAALFRSLAAALLMWLRLAPASTAGTSVHGPSAAAAAAVLFDADGTWPQCSEGSLPYLRDCVMPSDYFSYLSSKSPVIVTNGSNCSSLGFGLVTTHDACFPGFALYWKGGAAAFSSFYSGMYAPGHPQNVLFLNRSRDSNPACHSMYHRGSGLRSKGSGGGRGKDSGSLHSTTGSITAATTAAVAAAASLRPAGQTQRDDAIAVIYDAAGVHPQCTEGPLAYMRDCAFPSDFFMYTLSRTPTLISNGSTCAALGFQFCAVDKIFPGFKNYWRGKKRAGLRLSNLVWLSFLKLRAALDHCCRLATSVITSLRGSAACSLQAARQL